MRHLRIQVAYDGAEYAGWQTQPGQPTVQQVLHEAWRQVTGEAITLIGSGRTDSGVHALGQVCSGETSSELPPDVLRRALNACLPWDVRVLKVDEAAAGFHAQRDARRKTYRYQVQYGANWHVLLRRHYWQVRGKLDVAAMRQAAEFLIGRHDFSSFQAVGAERVSTIRTLDQLSVEEREVDGYDALWISISSNGFLYNMVRIIVGSLVSIGRGKHSAAWLRDARDARDRSRAGPTAPAHGLILLRVEYDD